MNRILPVIITILLLVCPANKQGRAADHEVLLGAVYKDTAFAVPKLSSDPPRLGPKVVILQGPLKTDQAEKYATKRYEFRQGVADNRPYRWRIVRDMFWGAGSAGLPTTGLEVKRISNDDLTLLDTSNAKRKEQYLAKYPTDEWYKAGGDSNALAWCVDPLQGICYRHLPPGAPFKPIRLDKAEKPTPGVYFDTYPIADDRLLLFVTDDDDLLVYSGTAKHGMAPLTYWEMDWGKDNAEIESIKSPLKETFTVFVRDKDYYFVTESGTIYLARNPGEKKERKVEKLWDGESKPVCALITDASNDKVYCFVEPAGKDKKDEERVYFELSAKPDPKPYKLTKIDKPQIDEPLKSVLEYAHVLVNDKKIKEPKAEK